MGLLNCEAYESTPDGESSPIRRRPDVTAHPSTEATEDRDDAGARLNSVANPRRVRWTALQGASQEH